MPPLTPPMMRSRPERVRRGGGGGGGSGGGGGGAGVSGGVCILGSVGSRDAADYWESSLGTDPRLDPMDLLDRVRATGLLAPATPVVVLLSGGRDSVCLLDVAVRLAGPR